MGTRFRPYQPDQPYLLPPSPSDWLSEDHLAYFVADVVDQLDLTAFYARYEGDGRRNSPYDPSMMLKVLVYAYATGVFSSRKIARKLEEDVAFRVLSAGNLPDFRTINRFRQQHLEEFQDLFVQVVRMARELKLLKLGTLAVDGSKVRAISMMVTISCERCTLAPIRAAIQLAPPLLMTSACLFCHSAPRSASLPNSLIDCIALTDSINTDCSRARAAMTSSLLLRIGR